MPASTSYFDTSGWDPRDVLSGGSRMIPINTPVGEFRVWTKRVGTNPDLKVLLLHGGPGASDELYECFDTWFPREGIEYYYYDQLGSFRSDQPDDPSLWDLDRFVDEVEQVRVALGSTAPTSCCSDSRGAACSRWSTRCTTRSTSKAW
jgi:proline iminopeptidase